MFLQGMGAWSSSGSVDTTPPVLSGVTVDNGVVTLSSSKPGTFFWMIDASATRTSSEIITGGGETSGNEAAVTGVNEYELDISPVGVGSWYLHKVLRDSNSFVSNVVSTAFTVAAPIVSITGVTKDITTASATATTDKSGGTFYWMVDTNASRTAAQVKTGGGSASGSAAVVAVGAQTAFAATGLSGATNYYFHVMHEDGSSIQSNVDTEAFMTNAAASGSIEIANSAISVSSSGNVPYSGGSFTVSNGDKRFLLALVHGYATSVGLVPNDVAITFGGVEMTQQIPPTTTINLDQRSWGAAYSITNPASGTGSLSLNWSLSSRANAVTLIEFTGVDQTGPVVTYGDDWTPSGSNVTSLDFTRTTAANGNMVVSSLAVDTGGLNPAVVDGGTLITAGNTGGLGTSDVSFATAYEAPVTAGAAGHGYTWSAADKAILVWLELKKG